MAENYKLLYEQMKKVVDTYQNEIVPNLYKELEKRVEVVRCKDCKHLENGSKCRRPLGVVFNNDQTAFLVDGEDDFCSYGERRNDEERVD